MDKLLQEMQSLKDRLAAINNEQAAIEDRAAAQNGGKFTDADREAYERLDKEHEEKSKELATLKADYDRVQARRGRISQVSIPSRRTPEPERATEPSFGRQRLAAEDDPNRGFRTHREFLSSVMEASRTGSVDERLNLCVAGNHAAVGSDEQSTFADPYGGFLVPAGFSPNLLSVAAESDPVASLTTQIPMTSATIHIPARTDKNHTTSVSGGLRVYRRAEGDTSPASRMEFEQVSLNATSLFGIAYATEELLARSPISFTALLDAGFRDEFGAKLLQERLNGTGAGMMEGILNCPALVEVAKETGQKANTVLKENIDKMRAQCWGYSKAVWLYNHDCLPQLRSLVQTVGTGGNSVPYFNVDANGQATLDGRPAFATEFTETLGTKGDLVLANWSQYLEGVLSGMSSEESIHVRFVNHERTFKFWVENDGRSWWRAPLTPKKGANPLSPFVVLASRS